MPENIIPVADLAVVTAGSADYLVAVQNGNARRVVLPEVTAASAVVEDTIEAIENLANERIDSAIVNMGYMSPVTYASGLSITSPMQTVSYLGTTYAPQADTVPFTTGAWDAARWRVIQGVTGSDLASTDAGKGGWLVRFIQAGVGAVQRWITDKLREEPSITDYGAVGDGVTDDTAAIQNALNAHKYVIVPAGLTPLISSTITVPDRTRLKFKGSVGNLTHHGGMSSSYFIKKSTMTTAAIEIEPRASVVGGGLLCQAGNVGDGVVLKGNSAALKDFITGGAGRDGVRVGTDGVYANTNSTTIDNVRSNDNGRHGFYVHDGVSINAADANAGTMHKCSANYNGGDGIRLGHAFWVSLINCHTEQNTGWGLYLSGANNNNYPECRWANVIGGDFNEGNLAGQVYDESYFSSFTNADQFQTAAIPAPTSGLQGAGLRSVFGGPTVTRFYGGKLFSFASWQLTVQDQPGGEYRSALHIAKRTTGGNGQGVGVAFRIDPGTGNYVNAAQIKAVQFAGGKHGLTFAGHVAGTDVDLFSINPNANTLYPNTDTGLSLGAPSNRWGQVFSNHFYPGLGTGSRLMAGTGSPEGNQSAAVGSIWLRYDGGAATSIYVKESGAGNTGWVAK